MQYDHSFFFVDVVALCSLILSVSLFTVRLRSLPVLKLKKSLSSACVCVVLPECYEEDNHFKYIGRLNITKSGRQCQRWDSQYPHTHDRHRVLTVTVKNIPHENYCRTPLGSRRPWCFTTDPGKKEEDCDLPRCPTTCMIIMYLY